MIARPALHTAHRADSPPKGLARECPPLHNKLERRPIPLGEDLGHQGLLKWMMFQYPHCLYLRVPGAREAAGTGTPASGQAWFDLLETRSLGQALPACPWNVTFMPTTLPPLPGEATSSNYVIMCPHSRDQRMA